MRIAVVKDGLVENVILADSALACEAILGPGAVYWELDDGDAVGPGYTFNGATFAPPSEV